MSVLIFLVVFALTIFLQQWLHRHIQGFALALTGHPGCALRLLFYLLLPGIILHEASHYVAAKLLLVRTGNFRVGVGRARGNNVSLGSVNVERSDIVRESLIGIAPFVVGLGAIWIIVGTGFGIWPGSEFKIDETLQQMRGYSRDWTTWLDLYLIFAVSTAMIPSESDREPWAPLVVILGFGVAILFLLGWTPRVPKNLVEIARDLLNALNIALGIAVIVNGVVAIALFIVERTFERLSGKRVDFRVRKRR